MASHVEILGRNVGSSYPTYIIAEAGINHNGDLAHARELVRTAARCGADAVKFQSFTAESLMTKSASSAAHLDAGAGRESVYQFLQRMALDRDAHLALRAECRSVGIAFLSSVLSIEVLAMMEDIGVEAYKIASMDLDNLPLLAAVASTGKPMILSTGMGSLAEVDRAVNVIHQHGTPDIVLLHCVSEYPAPVAAMHLRAMDTLRAAFQVPVGLSDHSIGRISALAAVAREAAMLEKHFTLDRTQPGPDQALSADPEEMTALIKDVRDVEAALGIGMKRPTAGEVAMRKGMRRSIVTARSLPAGHVIQEKDLTFKRPGSGMSPSDTEYVVGRRTAGAVAADTVLLPEHLL